LIDGLYEKHESFLANPLLLTIMLLTYGENAEVPAKLSIFYSQAYVALFNQHDARKGVFQRKRRSGLDIQTFSRVFAAFSLQCYEASKYEMPRSDALGYVERAKSFTGISVDEDAFVDDALRPCVC